MEYHDNHAQQVLLLQYYHTWRCCCYCYMQLSIWSPLVVIVVCQYSIHDYEYSVHAAFITCLCQRRGGNLAIFMAGCLFGFRETGKIWSYHGNYTSDITTVLPYMVMILLLLQLSIYMVSVGGPIDYSHAMNTQHSFQNYMLVLE